MSLRLDDLSLQLERFTEDVAEVERDCAVSPKRRRSESNRRMEVLQTSALPLGYGAGEREASAPPGDVVARNTSPRTAH